jgi:hypothetical protein
MSGSLIYGLIVVISRIGRCGHRTSLPKIRKKDMAHERKVNRKEELHHRIIDVA